MKDFLLHTSLLFLLLSKNLCGCEQYDKNEGYLCKLPPAKRMLQSLGIHQSSKCLLFKKKDISSLVTNYLEQQRDRDEENYYE